MKIENAVVLITGANRGIGLEFAKAALARGAKKVYAAARNPESIELAGVQKIKLDVTNQEDITALAQHYSDINIVINNAGIAISDGALSDAAVDNARAHFETNVLGLLRVVKALEPALKKNSGSAVLNVLSAGSWVGSDMLATYSASKAAAWSITNTQRIALKPYDVQVSGLHMGFVDTDLTRGLDSEKSSPAEIVKIALDEMEAGSEEIVADEMTKMIKSTLSAAVPVYLAVAQPT